MATLTTVVTREDVVAWAARNYGPRHAEQRVSEQAAAFVVDTNDDAVFDGHEQPGYGGVSIVVRKQSGGYWQVSHDPVSQSVYLAENDRALRRAMKTAGLDPARPTGTIGTAPPSAVTRAQVVTWLATRRGWRHLDDRITDLGWAYLVNTQPDNVLDGKAALSRDAGPLVVAKNGAVWALPWSPETVSALAAQDETTFHNRMFTAGHPLNPDQPTEWIPR
ncbi:MAG: hypothetical protein WBA97_07195 [Actinophytocola sp.]|uniref:hypothetical protein n=1 Tax=Actinophytocola sp. TaxID=1872138 RepID=UPI003C714210